MRDFPDTYMKPFSILKLDLAEIMAPVAEQDLLQPSVLSSQNCSKTFALINPVGFLSLKPAITVTANYEVHMSPTPATSPHPFLSLKPLLVVTVYFVPEPQN